MGHSLERKPIKILIQSKRTM